MFLRLIETLGKEYDRDQEIIDFPNCGLTTLDNENEIDNESDVKHIISCELVKEMHKKNKFKATSVKELTCIRRETYEGERRRKEVHNVDKE